MRPGTAAAVPRSGRARPGRYAWLCVLAALTGGCNIVGPVLYLTAPRQIRKAEFTLTEGRLAVLVEYARPADENPIFNRAFRDRLAELFREKKIAAQVVPEEELLRLRQMEPDFKRWSLQKIARAVNADQLLYVRIDQLRLQDRSDAPLLTPEVLLHLKVIDPGDAPGHARLWPPAEERAGREIRRGRQVRESSDAVLLDSESSKLGREAAFLAAMPFYDVDTEEPIPWEP